MYTQAGAWRLRRCGPISPHNVYVKPRSSGYCGNRTTSSSPPRAAPILMRSFSDTSRFLGQPPRQSGRETPFPLLFFTDSANASWPQASFWAAGLVRPFDLVQRVGVRCWPSTQNRCSRVRILQKTQKRGYPRMSRGEKKKKEIEQKSGEIEKKKEKTAFFRQKPVSRGSWCSCTYNFFCKIG